MPARLLVIQHEDDAPAAWFGEWLEEAGVALVVARGNRGDLIPASMGEYAGLLVLGGAMGAYDDATCPWLTSTKALIADAIRARQRPFLGICLGHQLAAVAVGGTVNRNPAGRTLGLTPVTRTAHGETHPLLGSLGAGARAMHWNDDIVTSLPGGDRQVLAQAPDGSIQAAHFGPLAFGVQFHPEVSPEVFASWGSSVPATVGPGSDARQVADAAQQLRDAADELRATWRPMAELFATMVRSTPLRLAAADRPRRRPDWWSE